MRSIKKILKRHKGKVIGILLIIVLVIGLLAVKNFFFPEETGVYYGNRLEGRDKVKITEETKNKIKDIFKDRSSSAKVRIAGRIIYIDVVVNDDVSRDDAKDMGNKTLEMLNDQEKVYYDVQLLINNKANQDQFPIIGYKHHTKDSIRWNKDR